MKSIILKMEGKTEQSLPINAESRPEGVLLLNRTYDIRILLRGVCLDQVDTACTMLKNGQYRIMLTDGRVLITSGR